jgi:hypothetical protein
MPEGIKLPESITNPMKGVSEQLGLIDLVNKINQAPIDLATKKAELLLKSNDVSQMAINNAISGLKLITEKNKEYREQSKFVDDNMKTIQDNFAQNYDLGVFTLGQKHPGYTALKNEDGTISISSPTSGKVYTIDPKNVADPEKKLQIARLNRNDWVNSAQDYSIKSQAYNNIIKSLSAANGAGDLVASYNFIKLIEPGMAGTVREGELITLKSTNPVTQNFINDYNNLLQNKKTLYGDSPTSKQRVQLLEQAKNVFETVKTQTEDRARFYHDFAQRNRIDPQDILQPVGDLTKEHLMGLANPPPANAAKTPSPGVIPSSGSQGAKPKKGVEAGFNQSNAPKEEKPVPSFQQIMDEWGTNSFGGRKN